MRPLLAALLVVPLVLAGCAAPPAEVEPAMDIIASEPTIDFAPAVAMPGGGGGEPNIAVLPDGTLFVTVPTGLQAKPNAHEGAAWLWRSQDGGETWEVLRKPGVGPYQSVGPFCSCDADVVTSPDGWVYYSDWWDGGYLVERSNDGGDTWMAVPMPALDTSVLTSDRQWLVAGEDGFVGLFFAHFPLVSHEALGGAAGEFNRGISAVFSTDHGESWSRHIPVVSTKPGEVTQIAHPRIMPDGALVMPYGYTQVKTNYWRDASEVRLAVSTDQGRTWTHHTAATAPEGFDNLWTVQGDVTPDGVVHLAWGARLDDDRMAMFYTSSPDVGVTWAEPTIIRGDGLNFLPWVAAASDGRVAVGWYGGDATGDPKEAPKSAEWFAYVAERSPTTGNWTVAKVDDVPVKKGPMCPTGAQCGSNRELLDYVSMVYAPDGQMRYAFARSDGGVSTLVSTALPAFVE